MVLCLYVRLKDIENVEDDIELVMPQDSNSSYNSICETLTQILTALANINLVNSEDLENLVNVLSQEFSVKEENKFKIEFEALSGRMLEENNYQIEDESIIDIKEEENFEMKKVILKEVEKSKEFIERKPPPIKFASTFCQVCQRTFYRKGDLENHMRIHEDVKPFQCSECGDAFRQLGMLLRHTRIQHQKQKDFVCRVCGKSFGYKTVLTEHLRSHSGVKPYKCTHCEQRFTQRSNMKKHVKVNHEATREFKCDLCSKQFVSSYYVNRHMLTVHRVQLKPEEERGSGSLRDTRCLYCKVTVKSADNLQEHIRNFHPDVFLGVTEQ